MVRRLSSIAWFALALAPISANAQDAVGVGPELVAPMQAAEMFKTVCVDTLPDFKKLPAVLSELGFVPAETGTFFNNTDDLSFKVQAHELGPLCTMVFGGDPVSDPFDVTILLAAVALDADKNEKSETGIEILEDGVSVRALLVDGSSFVATHFVHGEPPAIFYRAGLLALN